MSEIEFLEWLQHLRTPAADALLHAASALGSETAYMTILVGLYLCYHHRFGFHLLVLFLLSVYTNSQLKWIFDTPRPFRLFPERIEGLYQSGAGGQAYPSGHAQHATVVWGMIALRTRRRWVGVGAVGLIALVSFSRLYLGVHWPADVLGGLLAGAALLLAYVAVVTEWVEGRLVVRPQDWMVLLVAGGGMMLLFDWHDGTCVRASGSLLGAAVVADIVTQAPSPANAVVIAVAVRSGPLREGVGFPQRWLVEAVNWRGRNAGGVPQPKPALAARVPVASGSGWGDTANGGPASGCRSCGAAALRRPLQLHQRAATGRGTS